MLKPAHVLRCLAVALIALMATERADAQVRVDITQGQVQPMPIAVSDFIGNSEVALQISQLVESDLRRSGLFLPVDRAAFIERITDFDAAPRFGDWRIINAQALVTGRVTQQG